MDALDVDDVIAHLLVAEGFTDVEEVAFVPPEELTEIEGFTEDIAEELQERAQQFLADQEQQAMERSRELGVSQDILGIELLTAVMAVKLGENGVKTLDDLADLASDELTEIVGADALTAEDANQVIMAARAHWFDDEEAPEAEAEADASAAAGA